MVEKLVKDVDPSLKLIRECGYSDNIVLEVKRGKTLYILKMAYAGCPWGIKHLRNEVEILGLAHDVEGITHLVQQYDDVSWCASPMLKEYYHGEVANAKIRNPRAQKRLRRTVRDLHALGIANIDVAWKNVVVAPSGDDAKIVDLGIGTVYNRAWGYVPYSTFRKMKAIDLRRLYRLFG
jgi:hypothetical protein